MNQVANDTINRMGRAQIVAVLERWSFQCYDSESTEELREALRVNVEDGTIPPEDLDVE